MIVKMKFINISGPRNDIDRVTDQYLSRYEIQLESALSELKTVDNLRPFVELNPYREVLSKANEFVGYLPNAETVEPDTKLGLDDMFELVRKADEDYRTLQEKRKSLSRKLKNTGRTADRSAVSTVGMRSSPCASLSILSLIVSAVSQWNFIIRCKNILWMI